jgi:hypothetical protein
MTQDQMAVVLADTFGDEPVLHVMPETVNGDLRVRHHLSDMLHQRCASSIATTVSAIEREQRGIGLFYLICTRNRAKGFPCRLQRIADEWDLAYRRLVLQPPDTVEPKVEVGKIAIDNDVL